MILPSACNSVEAEVGARLGCPPDYYSDAVQQPASMCTSFYATRSFPKPTSTYGQQQNGSEWFDSEIPALTERKVCLNEYVFKFLVARAASRIAFPG